VAAGAALDVAASQTLTVAGTLVVSGSLAATGTVTMTNETDSVTLTKATITGDAATGATLAGADGTVTLADTDVIALAGTGTITVAADGSVALPNSAFGTGTYTADGAVTITAGSAGDTIETAAEADKGLLIGDATDGVKLAANTTTAMTYTLVKGSGTGTPVSLGGAYITVPADTSAGASLTATTSGTGSIVFGTTSGGIKLGKGSQGGKLTLTGSGTTIGSFNTSSSDDGTLPASADFADTAEDSGEKVDLGGSSSGLVTTSDTVTLYGATGSGEAALDVTVTLVAD
jgi:hypothetical protein